MQKDRRQLLATKRALEKAVALLRRPDEGLLYDAKDPCIETLRHGNGHLVKIMAMNEVPGMISTYTGTMLLLIQGNRQGVRQQRLRMMLMVKRWWGMVYTACIVSHFFSSRHFQDCLSTLMQLNSLSICEGCNSRT